MQDGQFAASPTVFSRAAFLFASGATLAALPARAPAQSSASPRIPRVERALVLSGGGARGAYEAGIIDYLVSSQAIPTGETLTPYGLVCGTSIGALNGYFVATGQYGLLRRLWYSIAREQPVRLKREYQKIPETSHGVGTRVAQAIHLAAGLNSNTRGILDGEYLRRWLGQYIDPQRPVLTPFIFTTTNLTTQQAEFFYMLPREPSAALTRVAADAFRGLVGPGVSIREATPDIVLDALRASAAIPVAFDPVRMTNDAGEICDYVDGGVTANTPVSSARIGAKAIDVIFLDPIVEAYAYGNTIEIATGVFGAMQRRILDADIRAAYLETVGKHALSQSHDARTRSVASSLYDVDIFTLRPKKELPVAVIGFDDAEGLFTTYKLGFADASGGFSPFSLV
ncbi:MAG: patatin-like phospholipase family protein [Candidatus Aquilonibacter sp.]